MKMLKKKTSGPLQSICLFLSLFSCVLVFALNGREKPRYAWPLKINNGFSSAFLEFRPTHFHAGIDFRTFQKNGFPVHAIAAGRVYQLRVDKFGPGQALYLRHADGYTSAYFHLDKFIPVLEDAVLKRQAEEGRKYFGLLKIDPPLDIATGELIAYSGESGSGLSHLHLEIRDSEDTALNPFSLLSFPAPDRNPPQIGRLVFRSRGPSLIDGILGEKEITLRLREGIYRPASEPVLNGPVDILVQAWDIADTGMHVAPASIKASINGNPVFYLRAEKIRRSDNIQVGLVFDLQRSRSGFYTYNLFYQQGYNLEELRNCQKTIFQVLPEGRHLLEIEVLDFFANRALARVPFHKKEQPPEMQKSFEAGSADRPLAHEIFVNRDHLFVKALDSRLDPVQLELKLQGALEKTLLPAGRTIEGPFFQVLMPPLLNSMKLDLEFQYAGRKTASLPGLSPLQVIMLSKGAAQSVPLESFKAFFTANAVQENRILVFRGIKAKSVFPDLARAVEMIPGYLPFLEPATISFRPSTKLPDPRQAGIFKKAPAGDEWYYLPTDWINKENDFRARVRSAGTYALLLDIFAPEITFIPGSWPAAREGAELRIRIVDQGKGVDDESLFISFNDLPLDCEYDHDRKEVKLTGLRLEEDGENIIRVEVADLAGNRSSKEYLFPRNQ